MSNINDAFPSKYLRASDLDGEDVTVTITRITVEAVGQQRETKPVVYVKEYEKGLVLNKTNAKKISQIAESEETNDWPGVQIKLYPTETEFQGETVDCIRVKSPVVPKKRGAKLEPVAHDGPLSDDDIPF